MRLTHLLNEGAGDGTSIGVGSVFSDFAHNPEERTLYEVIEIGEGWYTTHHGGAYPAFFALMTQKMKGSGYSQYPYWVYMFEAEEGIGGRLIPILGGNEKGDPGEGVLWSTSHYQFKRDCFGKENMKGMKANFDDAIRSTPERPISISGGITVKQIK